MSAGNIQFGSGVLFGYPNAGNTATNPTPQKFGILQEASVDFKGDLKKLFGSNQFPVAKARGKIDVTAKAKIASYDPNMLNQLYFGQTSAPGITTMAVDEAGAIPGSSTYIVTVANAAHFVADWGVVYAATGQRLTQLATGTPAAGQYTFSAGIYTFASADAGLGVYISYTYTIAARGTTITLHNQAMGYAPEIQAFLFNSFRGKVMGIQLNSVTLGGISIPTKQEDFWMADIDMEACTDAADVLGYIYADTQ